MKSAGIFGIASIFLLAACGQGGTPEGRELYHRLADRPVVCTAGEDCAKKWARAIQWVRENGTIYHAGYKTTYAIRRLTDTTIETDKKGKYPLFRIIKYPREDGTFGMDYYSGCEGYISCDEPSAKALRASFVSAVMGLPAGVKEVKPGTYQVNTEVFKF